MCKLTELGERVGRALHLAATDRGLDQLRQYPDRLPQAVRALGGPLGRGQRIVVAAEPVVALRAAPLVGDDPQPLAASQYLLLARLDERHRLVVSSAPLASMIEVRWERRLPVASTTASASAASDVATARRPDSSSTTTRSVERDRQQREGAGAPCEL